MRAGDVNFPFAQPRECELAGGGRGDYLDAADLFHHVREQTGGRIATRQHQSFVRGFFFGEYHVGM